MAVPRYKGVVRGFVAYHELPRSSRTVFIDEIAVARRGRGLGSRLLSQFQGKQVELRVHFNNQAGKPNSLYERLGFRECMGDSGVDSVFGYDDRKGYRCRICSRLEARSTAAAGELTHYESWRAMPQEVWRDVRALTHRAHRSYSKKRVEQVLRPSGPKDLPCKFFVALAKNAPADTSAAAVRVSRSR